MVTIEKEINGRAFYEQFKGYVLDGRLDVYKASDAVEHHHEDADAGYLGIFWVAIKDESIEDEIRLALDSHDPAELSSAQMEAQIRHELMGSVAAEMSGRPVSGLNTLDTAKLQDLLAYLEIKFSDWQLWSDDGNVVDLTGSFNTPSIITYDISLSDGATQDEKVRVTRLEIDGVDIAEPTIGYATGADRAALFYSLASLIDVKDNNGRWYADTISGTNWALFVETSVPDKYGRMLYYDAGASSSREETPEVV